MAAGNGEHPLQLGDSVSAVIERRVMSSSDSRVWSSTIEAILTAAPSILESNWKSSAHTTLGASAMIGGTEATPACLREERTLTCRPSAHHSRWIFSC